MCSTFTEFNEEPVFMLDSGLLKSGTYIRAMEIHSPQATWYLRGEEVLQHVDVAVNLFDRTERIQKIILMGNEICQDVSGTFYS